MSEKQLGITKQDRVQNNNVNLGQNRRCGIYKEPKYIYWLLRDLL